MPSGRMATSPNSQPSEAMMGRSMAVVGAVVAVLSVGVAGSVSAFGVPPSAGGPQGEGAPKATARLEVEAKPDCFTVRFFIKNEGDEAMEIVYGHGGGGQGLVPIFKTLAPPPGIIVTWRGGVFSA